MSKTGLKFSREKSFITAKDSQKKNLLAFLKLKNKSNKLNIFFIHFCKGEPLPWKLLLHKQNDAY